MPIVPYFVEITPLICKFNMAKTIENEKVEKWHTSYCLNQCGSIGHFFISFQWNEIIQKIVAKSSNIHNELTMKKM
jgi:hypothetical protein